MVNISQITVNNTSYEIYDVVAREEYLPTLLSQQVNWYVYQIDSDDTNSNISLSAASGTTYSYWKIVHKRIFNFSNNPSPFLYLINPIGEAISHQNSASTFFVGHFSYYDSSSPSSNTNPGWMNKKQFPTTTYPILHSSYIIGSDPSSGSTWTSELGLLSQIARTNAHMKLNSWILTKDNVSIGNVDTGDNGVLHTREIDIYS